MQIMAIFYSIIYIQYGAYTHHIIIGHSCVEYKEEVFVMIVYVVDISMELNEIKAVMTLAAEHGISINAESRGYEPALISYE